MPFKVTVPSKVIPFIIHVEPAVNRVPPWRRGNTRGIDAPSEMQCFALLRNNVLSSAGAE